MRSGFRSGFGRGDVLPDRGSRLNPRVEQREEAPPRRSAAARCRLGERRADPASALLRGSEAAVDGAGAQQGVVAAASVAGRVGRKKPMPGRFQA